MIGRSESSIAQSSEVAEDHAIASGGVTGEVKCEAVLPRTQRMTPSLPMAKTPWGVTVTLLPELMPTGNRVDSDDVAVVRDIDRE